MTDTSLSIKIEHNKAIEFERISDVILGLEAEFNWACGLIIHEKLAENPSFSKDLMLLIPIEEEPTKLITAKLASVEEGSMIFHLNLDAINNVLETLGLAAGLAKNLIDIVLKKRQLKQNESEKGPQTPNWLSIIAFGKKSIGRALGRLKANGNSIKIKTNSTEWEELILDWTQGEMKFVNSDSYQWIRSNETIIIVLGQNATENGLFVIAPLLSTVISNLEYRNDQEINPGIYWANIHTEIKDLTVRHHLDDWRRIA